MVTKSTGVITTVAGNGMLGYSGTSDREWCRLGCIREYIFC